MHLLTRNATPCDFFYQNIRCNTFKRSCISRLLLFCRMYKPVFLGSGRTYAGDYKKSVLPVQNIHLTLLRINYTILM